jgi:hypothetical protein
MRNGAPTSARQRTGGLCGVRNELPTSVGGRHDLPSGYRRSSELLPRRILLDGFDATPETVDACVMVVSEVLVEDVAGPAPATFDEFVQRERESVLSLALALLRSEDDAVDVAQETMPRALERWPYVSALDRPGAWTRCVALNLITDHLRSRTRRRRLLERLTVSRSDPSDTAQDHWDERFWAEVAALPPRRTPVLDGWFQGVGRPESWRCRCPPWCRPRGSGGLDGVHCLVE